MHRVFASILSCAVLCSCHREPLPANRGQSFNQPDGASEISVAPDFNPYPHTDSFRFCLWWQTSDRHLKKNNILAVSAFPAGERYALQYLVTESGLERDCREIYYATQAEHDKQLSDSDVKKLVAAIRELPPESTSPPLEQLVIVSFRDGTRWVTRSYDSKKLPKAMKDIYDIIGERFESKDKK